MSERERGSLIGAIIGQIHLSGRKFDEGDTFFSLCFKPDEELTHIAKLAGVL